MGTPILIGLGAGLLAAAILFASAVTGSLLAITVALFCLVPLPAYLAGLGWGATAALAAGLSGTAVAAISVGANSAVGFVLMFGVPATVLCHLALLSREVTPTAPGEAASGQPRVEWYPPGRLVAWATIMAGTLSALSIPMLGLDAESYRATVEGFFDKTVLSQLSARAPEGLDKEALAPLINLMVRVLPATTAMVGLGTMLFNLWAAGRLLESFGRASRPWPDLSTMTYPNTFSLCFVAALLLTFAPGLTGIVATGFSGAFLLAYVLLGLVVLHAITRASPMRPFLLFILYCGMIFFGWVALIVAIIGIGDPVFKLRARASNKPRPPASSGG